MLTRIGKTGIFVSKYNGTVVSGAIQKVFRREYSTFIVVEDHITHEKTCVECNPNAMTMEYEKQPKFIKEMNNLRIKDIR